jgi:hypothetical protein
MRMTPLREMATHPVRSWRKTFQKVGKENAKTNCCSCYRQNGGATLRIIKMHPPSETLLESNPSSDEESSENSDRKQK